MTLATRPTTMDTFGTRRRKFINLFENAASVFEDARKAQTDRFAARTEWIENNTNDETSAFEAAISYDFDHAPNVRGREQLLTVDIIPMAPQALRSPSDMHDELWTILEGLAKCGIYLLNTNHLNDSELYNRLYFRILDEETRGIPPSDVCSEFIDCLHPMDRFVPGFCDDGYKEQSDKPINTPYCRGPNSSTTTSRYCDRDRYLPRPSGF